MRKRLTKFQPQDELASEVEPQARKFELGGADYPAIWDP